ncbi:hypothetical protein HO173_005652 [Letharia columbiana]|uniref:Calcium channel YVC1-like C-terminal transmembrane domain-containing protein n=1 Tax=Letharia columbiana TaxID=112416 RepID=A0A8H6FWH0_9LECA|nr:uncharacterized protein HO173_005652 [Letharia columbiana]KAF6236024.1 hypothetical protein HO173_005652 [Letharia columbiana]
MAAAMPQTPSSGGPRTGQTDWQLDPPRIDQDEPLGEIVRQLSVYFIDAIEAPHTFEQLRTASVGHILKPLIQSISESCHHPDIVSALLILKCHFASGDQDDHGINDTRGHACEIVAWRFLTHLSAAELIDYLLHELPPVSFDPESYDGVGTHPDNGDAAEHAALLSGRDPSATSTRGKTRTSSIAEEEPMASFVGLNALEIAAVAGAKKFLSQRVVQKTVDDIWNGHIIFWESLSVHSKKRAKFYNKARADPYCRLRVPKYQKSFEALFFALFLGLYYAVLVERNPHKITPVEALLYIWIAAFAYDEFGEFRDAGIAFYVADFWSLWDIGIIGIGVAYMVSRIIGLTRDSPAITDVSFDILSLEALFLLPRVCSLLSLVPFFGTLIPCLKEMTTDFVKFLGIVIILFCGFLTTFTMLARGDFTPSQVLWIMINVGLRFLHLQNSS